jgi:hypothetical protein
MMNDTTTEADVRDEGPAVRRLLDNVREAGFRVGFDAAKQEALRLLRERWLAVSGDNAPSIPTDSSMRAFARRVLGESMNKVESLKPRRRQGQKGG